jgi:hypothetical protein
MHLVKKRDRRPFRESGAQRKRPKTHARTHVRMLIIHKHTHTHTHTHTPPHHHTHTLRAGTPRTGRSTNFPQVSEAQPLGGAALRRCSCLASFLGGGEETGLRLANACALLRHGMHKQRLLCVASHLRGGCSVLRLAKHMYRFTCHHSHASTSAVLSLLLPLAP